jgi:hypothetical protein
LKPIVAEVRGQIPADRETVFDVLAPIDLTTIMKGYGPLPAVVGVEDQTADWDSIGESRVIRLADGHGMVETLTAVDRPSHFAYTIGGLTNVLRLLVSSFRGAWYFEEAGRVASTPIVNARWRYEFESRSFLTWPLTWLIVKSFWRPYMENALALASAQAVVAYGHGVRSPASESTRT